MDTVVCVKHVPETAEADLVIRGDGRGIEEKNLTFDINEADNYALEEALLWKEKYGGSITVVTVGPEDANMTVRMCIAKGADRAIRLDDARFAGSDSYAIAKILRAALKDVPFDVVLTYSIGTLLRLLVDRIKGTRFSEEVGIPIAAGLIVGEALVGIGFAVHKIIAGLTG